MFLIDLLHDNSRQIEVIKHMLANFARTGTVSDVDAKKGYRLDWGDDGDGGRWKSPWYPHPEQGGAAKSWVPLSVGQTVTSINPTGDPRQGFLIRGGFSDQNAAPSQAMNESVFTIGDVRITVKNGSIEASVGGNTMTLTAAGLTTTRDITSTEGDIVNKGKSVGSTHKHSGVQPGGAQTAGPV